jgi:hypothetical protein
MPTSPGNEQPRPDAQTVRDLVALRLMLESAIARARAAGRYARGAAVVSLDATVERASYLVAAHRGIDVAPRDTLETLYSKLVQSFDGAWKSQVWPSVKSLHLERNTVQHHGREPDRDQLPLWVEVAGSYVRSLIHAEYACDLSRVMLSDAVDDPGLSASLKDADEALAAGNVAEAVDASLGAYDAAVSRWIQMLGNVHRRPRPGGAGFGDDQDRELEALRRARAESCFASSPAEQDWFRVTRAEPRGVLDVDDAERVLHFVFSWVAAFEVAARDWVPDRQYRAAAAARMVRSGDGPAQIADVVTASNGGGISEIVFKVVDVPPEPAFDRWQSVLTQLLSSAEGHWRINPDATVRVSMFDGERVGGAQAAALADALAQVEDRIAELDQEARDRQERLAAEATANNDALEQLRSQLPPWVGTVRWEAESRPGDGPAWAFSIPETESLPGDARHGVRQPVQRRILWMEVREALLRDDRVQQCYHSGKASILMLSPAPEPAVLVDILAAADATVSTFLDELSAHQQREAEATASLVGELRKVITLRQLRPEGTDQSGE